jgi:HSP20 family protein
LHNRGRRERNVHEGRAARISAGDPAGHGVAPVGPVTQPPRHLQSLQVMNQIVQWNPLHDLDQMHRRLTTLMNSESHNGSGPEGDWSPIVDITEDDSGYLIKAELPGVKKNDIHVTFENGLLTLRGERKFEREEKNRKYHRIEREYGAFTRTFELPENVDASKLTAAYEDGLLTVTVAKSEAAKPKRIEVRVG